MISKLYGKNPYDLYGQDNPGLLDSYGYPIAPNGGISSDFWFGIEPGLGRDVFTLLLYGIRTSLLIAVVGDASITVVIGVCSASSPGYLGGKTDYFIGRLSTSCCRSRRSSSSSRSCPVVDLALRRPRRRGDPGLAAAVALVCVHVPARLG